MSRYVVVSEWETHNHFNYEVWDEDLGDTRLWVLAVQVADIKDTKSSGQTVYQDGAYRIVHAEVDIATGETLRGFKPIKQGKGGTVPFFGEMAYNDAMRLYHDEVFKARSRSW